MTPQEKAEELISKFTFLKLPESDAKFYNPKQCALIAVEEIIKIERLFCENKEAKIQAYQNTSSIEFWLEVKEAIIIL